MGKPTKDPSSGEQQQRIAQLERVLCNHCCPTVVVSADGVVRMMSESAAAYLGGTPADFVAKSIRELAPERAEVYLERIRRVLQGRGSERFENEIQLPSGPRWFASIWEVVDDENGLPDAVLVTGFDITRQKELEDELRLTEGHLKALVETATDFAFYRLAHDPQAPSRMRVVFVSPSIRRIIGVSDSMNFEAWFARVHPQDVDRIASANRQAFETRRFNEQFRIYHEEAGEYRWIQAVSIGGADTLDPDRYVNGILFDISDKKRVEEELQVHQQHLSSLAENVTNFCIYRLLRDKDDPRDLMVLFVSPVAAKLLGVDNPMKFESWYDNVHPEDIERLKAADNQAIETGRFDEQIRIYDRNRSGWRWLHFVSSTSAGTEGRGSYVNGIMIDITERKQIEEKLNQYEQRLERRTRHLEEANTALRVIIEQRKQDVVELGDRIAANIEATILPFIKKMRNEKLSPKLAENLRIVESNLKSVTSPFAARLSSTQFGLTPTEIQVANYVKLGYTTKQISERMNVSAKTTDVHRLRIRKKLGIAGAKINLRAYLLSHLDN